MKMSHKDVIGNYYIRKIEAKTNYLAIELENEYGKWDATLKDNIDLFMHSYNIDDKIKIHAVRRTKKDKNYLDIIYIGKCDLDDESPLYEDYKERFEKLCNMVKDKELKSIIISIFQDEFLELFLLYPGAQHTHHNYPHGLLQHTVEVAELASHFCDYFKGVNKDLVITGALLHDIGKLKTYDIKRNGTENIILKTDWEHLLGHVSISALFVSKMIPPDISSVKMMLLYHLILSQHGKKEWGSPVECKTKESFILHQADYISMTMNALDKSNYINGWTQTDFQDKKWCRIEDILND